MIPFFPLPEICRDVSVRIVNKRGSRYLKHKGRLYAVSLTAFHCATVGTAECIDQIKGKHTPVIYIVGGGTKEEPIVPTLRGCM